jgi:Tol biopolymer transport system component
MNSIVLNRTASPGKHTIGWVLILAICLTPVKLLAQAQTIEIDLGYDPTVAPDGSYVAYHCSYSGSNVREICLYEIATGIRSDVTFDATDVTDIATERVELSNGASYIAFEAEDPGSSDQQVYLYDRAADSLVMISRGPSGAPANEFGANAPAITPDGRYVVFQSEASNLVSETVLAEQQFRYDRQTGTLEVSSATTTWDGQPVPDTGPYVYSDTDISDSGSRVLYQTEWQLVQYDNNDDVDAFVTDLPGGLVTRVSVDSAGDECYVTGFEDRLALSGDGDSIAMIGEAVNLSNYGYGQPCLDEQKSNTSSDQVFLRDQAAGITFMVSGTPTGEEPLILDSSGYPDPRYSEPASADFDAELIVSRDGRFIAYQHSGGNIVAGDANYSRDDIFVYDRLIDANTIQSIDESGSQWLNQGPGAQFGMSDDGRFLAFSYYDSTAGASKVYLRDRGDIFPPTIGQITTDPIEPKAGDSVSLFAKVSDAFTGLQPIDSAEFQVNGGAWQPMDATDGAFDSSTEDVQASIGTLSGTAELCIRATDALGWTSEPSCISLVIGGGQPSDLMARCFHTPIYVPTSGEVVTIEAEAINEDGTPVEADSIEIYLDLDREAPQLIETQASRAALEYPPSSSFAYSCLVRRGTQEYFSGWMRVGVDESDIDFPAIPVRIGGKLDDRIDVVFFFDEDEYDSFEDPAFIEDVGLLIQDGYFTIPWFVKWQKFFNFWIAKTPANTGPQPDSERCLREAPDKFKKRYGFADVAGIVHRSDCRDNAGSPGTFTVEMELDRLQTVAHESGHRPFGLADEYCCDGGYFTKQLFGPPFPNIFKEEPGCRAAAIDGGFDPDKCRSFTEDRPFPRNRDWWLFELDKRVVRIRDLMQGGGCAGATPDTPCAIQLPIILGSDPDPNGLYPCSRPIETIYVADVDSDGVDASDAAWGCRSTGSATEAVWEPNTWDDGTPRPSIDRHKIGDSEQRRMFWMLNECLAGRC